MDGTRWRDFDIPDELQYYSTCVMQRKGTGLIILNIYRMLGIKILIVRFSIWKWHRNSFDRMPWFIIKSAILMKWDIQMKLFIICENGSSSAKMRASWRAKYWQVEIQSTSYDWCWLGRSSLFYSSSSGCFINEPILITYLIICVYTNN